METSELNDAHSYGVTTQQNGAANGGTFPTRAPSRIRSYNEHATDVITITGPIIKSEIISQNLFPMIDVAFVGILLDNNDLAAAAPAIAWFNIWDAVMIGFYTVIDTFLLQTYGAKELQGYAMWTGTGLAIAIIVTCFIAGLVALCGPVMKLFGQDEVLAERAGHFSYALIPGFFANGVNILLNWLLIYKLDMGLNGAPWATSFTRFAELVVICGYMVWNRHSAKLEATWPVLSRGMWPLETESSFWKLACLRALSLSAEMRF